MSRKAELVVKNINVNFFSQKEEDYISLTDIAKYKNSDDPRFVIQNWMKTRSTVEFLGIWEVINNPCFNRVEFDTVKNEAGSNAFVLTPSKWIKLHSGRQLALFQNQGDMAVELMPIKILPLNLHPGFQRNSSSI